VEIGGTTVGSYDVFESDYATPWTDESVYTFGSATSGGTDPGGLAGATMTDSAFYPSFNAATAQKPPADVTAALHDIHVTLGNGEVDNLLTTASGTYYSVDDPGVGSALWFEAPGSTDASLIWSGLADTSAALAAVEVCPAYCRPTCGSPASEVAELDGSNLDRSWIEFGGSDRFSGVALGYALIGADRQCGTRVPRLDSGRGQSQRHQL
jgi:hypothetical protein